jgi:hypothetical protein
MFVQSFVVLPHHGLFSRPLTNARVHSMDWQHGDWVLLGGDAGRGVKVLGVLQPPCVVFLCDPWPVFFLKKKNCAWSLPSPVWAPLVVCYNRCRLAWQKEHCCTGTPVVCTVSTVEAFPPPLTLTPPASLCRNAFASFPSMSALLVRYLSVSSGADLPSQGRALAHHFDTVGSPVMMGE